MFGRLSFGGMIMKKLSRKVLAGALALTMAVSVASMQASATQVDGNSSSFSILQAQQNHEAITNSIGLGNNGQNLLRLNSYDWATYGVNLFSGNLVMSASLYEEGGPYTRDFILTYNSLDDSDFGFGKGFRTNYCMKLLDNGDGTFTFIDDTGTPFLFSDPDGDGTYMDVLGRDMHFYDNEYQVMDDPYMYTFNQDGVLTKVSGGGLASYRVTELTYDDQGNLVNVYTPVKPGFMVSSEYRLEYSDVEGYDRPMVTKVTGVKGGEEEKAVIYNFRYSQDGTCLVMGNNERHLEYIIDPESGFLTRLGPDQITYISGSNGMVASNTFGNYQYLYGNLQTVVNADGMLTLYRFDESGMLIE